MSKSIFDKIRERTYKDSKNRPKRKQFFRTTYVQYGRLIGRVVPKHPDQELPFLPVGRHYNVAKYPILCPTLTTSHMDNQLPCPVCEFTDQLLESGEKEDLDMAKNISVSPRYLWYFIIRKLILQDGRVEVPEQEPVVLELPPTAHNQLISKYFLKSNVSLDSPLEMEVDESQVFHFDDPDTGVDVIITKTSGTPVKYGVELDPTGPSPLGTPEEVVHWMDQIENLDEYVPAQLESYKKLESLIIGSSGDDEGDVPEPEDNVPFEPTPAPTTVKPVISKPKAGGGSLADLVAKNMANRGKK